MFSLFKRLFLVILAIAILIFFGIWSMIYAGWAGSSLTEPGWSRAASSLPGMSFSLISGLIGIGLFRWILRWPIRSWWLLLAFVIPIWGLITIVISAS